MGFLKKLICFVLVLATLALAANITVRGHLARVNGDLTLSCHMTAEDQQWIRDQFGHCPDLPSLIRELNQYAMDHFTYTKEDRSLLWFTFDMSRFRSTGKGVCWEFAFFGKCCVDQWAAMHELEVSNYVVSVLLDHDPDRAHAYNYVILDGTVHSFDLTSAACHDQLWYQTVPGTDRAQILEQIDNLNETFCYWR